VGVSYVERRTLEVRRYDRAPDDPLRELDELVVAALPTLTGAVDLEELPEAVRGALTEYGVESYLLEDRRSYRRWGARGSSQEVVLSVPAAGSEPALDNAVRSLVEHLLDWTRERRRRERRMLGGELAEVTSPLATPSIEEQEPSDVEPEQVLSATRRYMSDHFGVSEDDLTVKEARQTPEGALIVLEETRSGRTYRIEVSEAGNLMRFAKVATRRG
jgi:hypothetical protein